MITLAGAAADPDASLNLPLRQGRLLFDTRSYQQARRWLRAGCFEALTEDLRMLLRLAAGKDAQPSAAVIDSRTVRSTPESGARRL